MKCPNLFPGGDDTPQISIYEIQEKPGDITQGPQVVKRADGKFEAIYRAGPFDDEYMATMTAVVFAGLIMKSQEESGLVHK